MQISKFFPAMIIAGFAFGVNAEEIEVPDIINSQPQKSIQDKPLAVAANPNKESTKNSRPVIFNSMMFNVTQSDELEIAHNNYKQILSTRQLDENGRNLVNIAMPDRAAPAAPALPAPTIRQIYLSSIIYKDGQSTLAWINNTKYKVGDSFNNLKLESAGPEKARVTYDLSGFSFNFDDERLKAAKDVTVNKEKKTLTFSLIPNHRFEMDVMKVYAGKSYNVRREPGQIPIGQVAAPAPQQQQGQMPRGPVNLNQQRPGYIAFPAPLGAQGQIGNRPNQMAPSQNMQNRNMQDPNMQYRGMPNANGMNQPNMPARPNNGVVRNVNNPSAATAQNVMNNLRNGAQNNAQPVMRPNMPNAANQPQRLNQLGNRPSAVPGSPQVNRPAPNAQANPAVRPAAAAAQPVAGGSNQFVASSSLRILKVTQASDRGPNGVASPVTRLGFSINNTKNEQSHAIIKDLREKGTTDADVQAAVKKLRDSGDNELADDLMQMQKYMNAAGGAAKAPAAKQ